MTSSSSGSCGSDRKRSVSHISAASIDAARHAGNRPDGDADDDRDHHRGQSDGKRYAAAVEHAREQVLAEIVGAERMAPRRAVEMRS